MRADYRSGSASRKALERSFASSASNWASAIASPFAGRISVPSEVAVVCSAPSAWQRSAMQARSKWLSFKDVPRSSPLRSTSLSISRSSSGESSTRFSRPRRLSALTGFVELALAIVGCSTTFSLSARGALGLRGFSGALTAGEAAGTLSPRPAGRPSITERARLGSKGL